MRSIRRLARRSPVAIGIALVIILSFGLRFWHLDQFNDLVFDEVYYVKFAQAYLASTASFDAHPPLGKYLIAVGIWLGNLSAFSSTIETAAVGLSPASYRWMNALVGSLIPLVALGICWHLDRRTPLAKRWTFSLLTGAFVAIDGLFITESRYALINIHMVFFGLLGHYLWLQATHVESRAKTHTEDRRNTLEIVLKTAGLRILAAISLGASVAVKWNGLGYFLSLLVWEGWRNTRLFQRRDWIVLVVRFTGIGLAALLTYCLIWWPHLHFAQESVATVHYRLLTFHHELTATHPACARWYTWPLLIKPVSYWYVESNAEGRELVQAVNNLGNPALWGLSAATVLLLLLEWPKALPSKALPSGRTSPSRTSPSRTSPSNTALSEVRSYLLIGYLSNWLPWMMVERCTYNYLFMPAAVFGFMALALAMSEWLCGPRWLYRAVAGVMLGGIAIAFLYWLPLSLGLPLTPQDLQNRWWLQSWI